MTTQVHGVGLLVVAALSGLLVACSTSVQKVPVGAALVAPIDAGTKIIQFRKIADALPKGELVGKSRFGVLCIPGKPLAWRDGRVNVNDDEFAESFRQEVEKAKFATVVESGATLETAISPRAGFLVSGQVAGVSMDTCAPWSDFGNWRDARGGAYVKVQWQVYSTLQKKVVYETATEGSYQTDDSVSGGTTELMRSAFASATQNLLADAAFYRTIHGDKKGASAMAEPLRAMEAAKGASAVDEPRSAVFTVIAGMNRGSGFVVSADGYLITSEHTVRGYQLVKLKSATGRESLGFVIRRDEQSDVALVQLTERNASTLALRSSPAVLAGEDVYVMDVVARAPDIGIRKGAVGTQKDAVGPKWVRTSVPLAPLDAGAPFFDKTGKVVGVAVASAVDDPAQPTGGFVPISEVLARLALSFK
ncbi:serine protease [Rhodoferax saidenbachensis]|uniref:S1-C subfamily serine protease n=1 Tax=Rhodoferax saidenbachensis TaxID=1484693 RepID=A0ABU1ZSM1_9BURK|nr:serine protease [Rhodoferax saidenbachensis]MDR7308533.1 S1-C subfamily serine protease [Rhodoferax saidenbachensis]